MNEVPPIPAVPLAPAVPPAPPLPGQQKSWARSAALCSVGAPVLACALGLLFSGLQTQRMKSIVGVAILALILAGLILAIVALAGGPRQGRKGGKGPALAGLSLNVLLLLGLMVLLTAVGTIAQTRTTGYTLEEMRAMPQVMPGARVIMDRTLGFRVEVPAEFIDNPLPQPQRVLYSFVRPATDGPVVSVSIARFGRIMEPHESTLYDKLRRMSPDTPLERAPFSWKTHQLEACRSQLAEGGQVYYTWGVPVPLARDGVLVAVQGPPESNEECHRLLGQLLTGLEGISNWDSPAERMARAKSLRPGPRVGHAAESASSAIPGVPVIPVFSPADSVVAAGRSEIRTFPGAVPPIPERNSKLIYEFDLSREPVLIHVPANYDGSTPFGLIIFLPGDGSFTEAPRGWEKVLAERRLLFVSPQKGSNARESDQRCGLAVVCALKMSELYKIDPRRVYAAGYSGGGRMAARLGYYHPDLFSGTIQSCGSDFHRRVPAVKTIPLERDKGSPYGLLSASPDEIKAARQKVRFVIVTGPGDFRYGHLWDIYEGGFRKDGFQARLIDDPLMDHVTCGPYPLRQALNFIERGRTP